MPNNSINIQETFDELKIPEEFPKKDFQMKIYLEDEGVVLAVSRAQNTLWSILRGTSGFQKILVASTPKWMAQPPGGRQELFEEAVSHWKSGYELEMIRYSGAKRYF